MTKTHAHAYQAPPTPAPRASPSPSPTAGRVVPFERDVQVALPRPMDDEIPDARPRCCLNEPVPSLTLDTTTLKTLLAAAPVAGTLLLAAHRWQDGKLHDQAVTSDANMLKLLDKEPDRKIVAGILHKRLHDYEYQQMAKDNRRSVALLFLIAYACLLAVIVVKSLSTEWQLILLVSAAGCFIVSAVLFAIRLGRDFRRGRNQFDETGQCCLCCQPVSYARPSKAARAPRSDSEGKLQPTSAQNPGTEEGGDAAPTEAPEC